MKTLAPVVVVGAGHAGVEAAAAAARLGCDVVLLTLSRETLVRLSCNPAIGGIGKGHLVREIDALGGIMGLAADLGGIHFRMLNSSRGTAVQGPRAQQDYDRYPGIVGRLLADEPRIQLEEGEAAELILTGGAVEAVATTDGRVFPAAAVVLTSGTFLRGRMFQGEMETPGGRTGERAADALSAALTGAGLRVERFKTGTPPRLEMHSLDLSALESQPGDAHPTPFSFLHMGAGAFSPPLPQTVTRLTKTNPRTHALVRGSLDRSPLYTGRIRALGPRYCPSFEDKVVKFGDRESHLIHLEPMGLEHPWIYVNGLSTSLPQEVQEEVVHSIDGLAAAKIARHGYAVEYDFVPPTQLLPTLEVRGVRGLFLAGQICGTTGYEEAAGLGLVAGANAGLRAKGRAGWVPDRRSSYLGVMVDDLTVAGVLEPYRMFTSRAEMRLSLAADSADRRLTAQGEALGLVGRARGARAESRWARIEAARRLLETPPAAGTSRTASPADRVRQGGDAIQVMRECLPADLRVDTGDETTLASLIRYRGYLERELRETARLERNEYLPIPEEFDFAAVPGLSHEVRQRLLEVRPETLGRAARIPGLTPAAVGLLAAAIGSRRDAAS